MAIKRKATESVAGESPTKRVTRLQATHVPDVPPRADKVVVRKAATVTPRGKTYNGKRSMLPEPAASIVSPRRQLSPESDDELILRPTGVTPSRTRSGKARITPTSDMKVPRPKISRMGKPEDLVDDIPSPPPSPTKRVTRAAAKASPAKLSLARSSPVKALSPAKRRTARARTPSPVPDSEPEGRDASPPVASSSRRASSPAVSHVEEPPFDSYSAVEISTPSASPGKLASQHCLDAQKREILRAIQNPPDVVDDEESANQVAHKQLSDLLKGTVVRGEGNSCLLLGPRGSGKTRILNQCLSELPDPPIVLRLSGWSQQTDRLAMREVAYQLSQQTGKSFLAAADDDEASDEADSETNPLIDTPNPITVTLPPATHLPALISLLPTLARPTVIILDAFDLFAQHPRQSLLYCLLDTVQSCRAGADTKGIAVIGLTTHVDTINLLEKRVKSRFSGRMLRTASPSQSQDWMALTRGILCSKITTRAKLDETGEWQRKWEAGVQSFLRDEATTVVLKETFSVTKDVRVLGRLLTSVATQLSPSAPFPTSTQLVFAAATQRSRPRFSMLHVLPYPSICLLIACVHAETAGHPTFTFEMLREKVRDQIRLSSSAPVEVNGGSIGMPACPRTVLMSAFEALVAAKIFAPTTAPSVSLGKEFVKFRAEVSREDVKKAVQTRNDINLTKWLTKATQ